MSDVTPLRIGILIAGLILIAAIMFFGRPRKPGQGKRVARDSAGEAARVEPTLGEQGLERLGAERDLRLRLRMVMVVVVVVVVCHAASR